MIVEPKIKPPAQPTIGSKKSGGISVATPAIGGKKLEPLSVNPLNKPEVLAQHTGDTEHDNEVDHDTMLKELSAVQKGEEQQRQAVALANDTRFWCAIYFQTSQQKEEFLRATGLFEHGQQYLDGEVVAEKIGVKLTPREVAYKVGRTDKKCKDLT